MTLPQATLLAAILLFALAAFHAALAFGAPLGALAWGGENVGRLPDRLRRGSGFLAVVIAAMAIIMLMRGGLLFPEDTEQMVIPVWGVFVFLVLQASGALRSESRQEKRFMLPLYVIATAVTAFVAFGNHA